jgi:hypothetical protein
MRVPHTALLRVGSWAFPVLIRAGSFSIEASPTLRFLPDSGLFLFPSPILYAMVWVSRLDLNPRSGPMEWTTPQHEEIDLNCEISSYANAEL